jgi:hypothetical protein
MLRLKTLKDGIFELKDKFKIECEIVCIDVNTVHIRFVFSKEGNKIFVTETRILKVGETITLEGIECKIPMTLSTR